MTTKVFEFSLFISLQGISLSIKIRNSHDGSDSLIDILKYDFKGALSVYKNSQEVTIQSKKVM